MFVCVCCDLLGISTTLSFLWCVYVRVCMEVGGQLEGVGSAIWVVRLQSPDLAASTLATEPFHQQQRT